MRVAIVGSRDYYPLVNVVNYVMKLAHEDPETVIVSGGAPGVDRQAEITAREIGLKTDIFPADWDRYGKSAGFKRNVEIVENCDRLVAFWDGKSRGTQHSIRLAREKMIPVEIQGG